MRAKTIIVGIGVYAIPLVVYILADYVGRNAGHKYLFRLGWVGFLLLFIWLVVKFVFPWAEKRE
jgi:hypothetical protein